MNLNRLLRAAAVLWLAQTAWTAAEIDTVIVRPRESDEVLVNPGIGFTTFQRFNGDSLNQGTRWTEGFPIEYQPFNGNLTVKGQPMTSVAYFRVYWRFLEPAKGKYRWDLIDKALATAHSRGQTLMLRVAPYGTDRKSDVPDWYRAEAGDETGKLPLHKWLTDPEHPRYLEYFGRFIREFGKRYDGNPDVELVDISIVGSWGESAGTQLLKTGTRDALLACYFETFRHTPLVMQMEDHDAYASQFNAGPRFDCLGDMGGGFRANWGDFPGWSHMLDYYPRTLVQTGLQDAWRTAPVSLEACGVMQTWKNYGWNLDYILDQALKWHISTFNNKSSAVPEEWRPKVDTWLKRVGYRFVLRSFSYPKVAMPGGRLGILSWWENKGVAPIYHEFPLALRLTNGKASHVFRVDTDIRKWLPGDVICEKPVFLPPEMATGEYEISVAILDPQTGQPKVKLAIEGRGTDGWYPMGKLQVRENAPTWSGGHYPTP